MVKFDVANAQLYSRFRLRAIRNHLMHSPMGTLKNDAPAGASGHGGNARPPASLSSRGLLPRIARHALTQAIKMAPGPWIMPNKKIGVSRCKKITALRQSALR